MEFFTIEVWARTHGENISFAVRADTDRWVALLFKDFPHHGMIGDFNDVKLLTVKGIEDFFVAELPDQKESAPRKTAGVHT